MTSSIQINTSTPVAPLNNNSESQMIVDQPVNLIATIASSAINAAVPSTSSSTGNVDASNKRERTYSVGKNDDDSDQSKKAKIENAAVGVLIQEDSFVIPSIDLKNLTDPNVLGGLIQSLFGLINTYQERADMYASQGLNDLAAKDISHVKKLKDKNSEALLLLGNIHQCIIKIEGDLDLALSQYNRCLELNDKNFYVLFARAQVYRLKGNFHDALSDIDKCLEIDNKSAQAFYERAVLCRLNGYLDPALDDLNKSIELVNNNAQAFYERGLVFRLKGNLHLAFIDHCKSIELDDKNPLAFAERGAIHARKGNIDQALSDFDQSLELNDENSVALIERASIHTRKGDLDRALSDLDKSIELDDKSALAFELRGGIHIRKGNTERALSDLDKSIELNDKKASTFAQRGILHSRKGNLDLALSDLDKSLKLKNNEPFVLRQRGSVHTRTGNLGLALSDFNESLELDPENWEALAQRGLVHARMGNLDLSFSDFNKSLELNPNYAEGLVYRGEINLKKGNLELALKDFHQSKQIQPDITSSHFDQALLSTYYEGMALMNQKKFGVALVSFNNYLKYLSIGSSDIPNDVSGIIDKKIIPMVAERTSYFRGDNASLDLIAKDLTALHDQLAEASTPRFFSLDPASKGVIQDLQLKFTEPKTKYELVYKLLIAMQELSEHKSQILFLDNRKDYDQNIGEQYAFALTGILTHSKVNKEVIDPIGQYIDTLIATHAMAKANRKLKEFFEKAFSLKDVCLGAKSKTLTEYAANLSMDLVEIPDIGNFSDRANAYEFFRAFRVTQVKKMAVDKSLDRVELMDVILKGTQSPHQFPFFNEYLTVENFKTYLNDYPASQEVKNFIPALVSDEHFKF